MASFVFTEETAGNCQIRVLLVLEYWGSLVITELHFWIMYIARHKTLIRLLKMYRVEARFQRSRNSKTNGKNLRTPYMYYILYSSGAFAVTPMWPIVMEKRSHSIFNFLFCVYNLLQRSVALRTKRITKSKSNQWKSLS